MIKNLIVLTTLATDNEQTGVSPRSITASGTSREYPEFAGLARAVFLLSVTAIPAAATLDVVVEGWDPVGAVWRTDVTITQQTAVGNAVAVKADLYYQLYRAKWTIGGTAGTTTFSFAAIGSTEEAIF